MNEKSIECARARLRVGGEGAFLIGEPIIYKALGVCPLYLLTGSRVRYLTYEEALEKGTVSVSEVGENGSVPELLLENTGKEKVLIMDSEQLVGAKQNRVLNTTVLIAASSKVVIPVSCVEQGRWRFSGEKQMRDSVAPLYAKARASKSRQVNYNLLSRREYSSDQSAIWGEISSRLESEGISAPTHAMDDHYTSRMRELKAFQEQFSLDKFKKVEKGTLVGAAFTLSGKILGMDAFDKSETLRRQWAKLINSYAIEAVREGNGGAVDIESVRLFLGTASASDMQVFEPPGLGDDVRITGEKVVGSALVFGSHVIHIYAFNTDEEERRQDRHTTRMASYQERMRRRPTDQ